MGPIALTGTDELMGRGASTGLPIGVGTRGCVAVRGATVTVVGREGTVAGLLGRGMRRVLEGTEEGLATGAGVGATWGAAWTLAATSVGVKSCLGFTVAVEEGGTGPVAGVWVPIGCDGAMTCTRFGMVLLMSPTTRFFSAITGASMVARGCTSDWGVTGWFRCGRTTAGQEEGGDISRGWAFEGSDGGAVFGAATEDVLIPALGFKPGNAMSTPSGELPFLPVC